MADDRTFAIARAIFLWLNRPHGDDGNGLNAQPPYTFNENETDLTISVDGHLDCRALASAIDGALAALEPSDDPSKDYDPPGEWGMPDYRSK